MPDLIPVVLLGRLAVDERFAGRGLGSALLQDAIVRSIEAAETIAAAALLVHATMDSVVPFYEQYGFSRFPESGQTVFLRFIDARKSLQLG